MDKTVQNGQLQHPVLRSNPSLQQSTLPLLMEKKGSHEQRFVKYKTGCTQHFISAELQVPQLPTSYLMQTL